MAGSEDRSGPPGGALWEVPVGVAFLPALAKAVIAGWPLPNDMAGARADPFRLSRTRIYLPSRRAAKAARVALLDAAGGKATLLPDLRPLGAVAEDELAALLPNGAAAQGALALPPAIDGTERHFVLARLLLAWSRARAQAVDEGDDRAAIRSNLDTPAQALMLARALSDLMDEADQHGLDWAALGQLVPDGLAHHWQETLSFLAILSAHWPAYLAERARLSPMQRRMALLALEAESIALRDTDQPVIIAGLAAPQPALMPLVQAVARHPAGAIVLSGLDRALDEASFASLLAGRGHPEHPQYGHARLLEALGACRSDARALPGAAPATQLTARTALLSQALRPAETTDLWRGYLASTRADTIAQSLHNVTLITAPSAQDEAEAIALILRQAADQPEQTAALITRDRGLARRVASRLTDWDIRVDDSAGRPLAVTPVGAFFDLILAAMESDCAALPFASLVKHPLCRLGRSAPELREAVRLLDRLVLREAVPAGGLAIWQSVAADLAQARANRGAAPLTSLPEVDALLADCAAAIEPLAALWRTGVAQPMRAWLDAHVATAELLARDDKASIARLWRGEAGEAMASQIAEWLAAADHAEPLLAGDYPAVFRTLSAGAVVRATVPAHPRLFIWGPLEARLMRPDIVILGAVNEGTWPDAPDGDPWLSRPMRATLGLDAPEARIGLSAHDFVTALGGERVFITRAAKIDGVPSVPSRWLLRLQALLEGAGCKSALETGADQWIGWALARDRATPRAPATRPHPKPAVALRPKRLSVTRVEKWGTSPYRIFAEDMLRLRELAPLGGALDGRLRGTLIHDALHRLARSPQADAAGPALAEALTAHMTAALGPLAEHPVIMAFWLPRFVRFAGWYAETEPARAAETINRWSEVAGQWSLVGEGFDFTLTARADRLDLTASGHLIISDYKSGQMPSASAVKRAESPQLALEALIAQQGGFEGVAAAPVQAVRYIAAQGGTPPGAEMLIDGAQLESAITAAEARLKAMVQALADPAEGFRARATPQGQRPRYDPIAQLAREAEWLGGQS